MNDPKQPLTRRVVLTTAGSALLAAGAARRLDGADWTAEERVNVQIVNDFCAAMPMHDVTKVMSFFSDNCAYRLSETQEPSKGRQAVAARIGSYLDHVERFEVLETFARGPMVFNERIDHFTEGGLRSWHGVGVFFLKSGKIVEWYDYTISIDRAK